MKTNENVKEMRLSFPGIRLRIIIISIIKRMAMLKTRPNEKVE